MKYHSAIILFFSLLAASPAFGQTQVIVGILGVNFSGNQATSGDSSTLAYNSNLQLNERVFLALDTSSGHWNMKTRFIDHVYDLNGNILYYLMQVIDVNNAWINLYRNAYTYDASGNQLTYVREKWYTTNGWTNFQRKISTYGLNGEQLSVNEENWNGTNWVNQSEKYWVYDANGKVLSITQANYRVLFSYNAQNLLDTKIEQEINGNWVNKTRTQYTYLLNDTKIASETISSWLNNDWEEQARSSDTYDANGNIIQHLNEVRLGVSWVNFSQEWYNYDANGYLVQDLDQEWIDTAWENSSLELYGYDAAYNLIYWTWQVWEAGNWKDALRQFNGFDTESNWINTREESWDGTSWELYYYVRNHYSEFVATHGPSLAAFEVFPNPASSAVTIKGEGLNRAMIFDQKGRLVHAQNLQGQPEATLQLGNLSAGNYFLQVLGSDGKVGAKPLQIRD